MKSKITDNVSYEDFKKIYRVFKDKPYEEKYTEEDYKEIYESYIAKGKIYGAYVDERIVGLIAVTNGARKTQPVSYENKKVLYLADVAVDSMYRKQGLGTKLMSYIIAEGKLGGNNVIYMRTLKEGSMSASIAKKLGFKQIEGIEQDVETESIYGNMQTKKNIFLELDLDSLDKAKISQILINARIAEDPEVIKKEVVYDERS